MEKYIVLAFFVTVNIATFAIFWRDKRSAAKGAARVPEVQLLLWSFLGGWPGAKIAQLSLRHKTVKQPFGKILNCVPLVWIACASFLGVFSMLPATPENAPVAALDRETPRFFQTVDR